MGGVHSARRVGGGKTVETVLPVTAVTNTPLKQGVNESWPGAGRGFMEALNQPTNSKIPAPPIPPPTHMVTRP
jgi:hypothetical protein